MPAGFELRKNDGSLICTNRSKIIKVDTIRTEKTANNGVWGNYYYTGFEESNKIILVRPSIIGQELHASTVYSNAVPYAEIVSYLPNTTTNTSKVEVAICSIADAVSSDGKYLIVYDEQGNFSFSLDTFIKGVKIIYYALSGVAKTNVWQPPIRLPSHVNINNLFVILPYSHIRNDDNGTAPTYSASGFAFKFTSDNFFHYKATGYSNNGAFDLIEIPIIVVEITR